MRSVYSHSHIYTFTLDLVSVKLLLWDVWLTGGSIRSLKSPLHINYRKKDGESNSDS